MSCAIWIVRTKRHLLTFLEMKSWKEILRFRKGKGYEADLSETGNLWWTVGHQDSLFKRWLQSIIRGGFCVCLGETLGLSFYINPGKEWFLQLLSKGAPMYIGLKAPLFTLSSQWSYGTTSLHLCIPKLELRFYKVKAPPTLSLHEVLYINKCLF